MKNRFGLQKKIVLGIATLSMVTYGTSFLFLFVFKEFFLSMVNVSEGLFLGGVLILGVFWSSLFGYIAARFLTKPLVQLEQTAEAVATGDLRVKVEIPKGNDELRSLALAFERMLSNLKMMVREIEENFQQTEQHVQDLTAASGIAAAQAEQIGFTIEDIARGAQNQSAVAMQMVTSLEQLNQTVVEVNQRADETRDLSNHMGRTIETSTSVVQTLIEGMQHLAKESEFSVETVRKLELKAKEIGEISKLVGSMAEQTNLLALNASIEAARAGEHGRGFAVVAQEVRKLADESGKAVQGINDLIFQMQQEVDQAVKQITEQVRLAFQESQKGEETTRVLQDISLSVQQVVQSVDTMVGRLGHQVDNMNSALGEAREVADIAEAASFGAQEVASSAQEQTAAMEEIASTGQVLRQHSETLQEHIRRFTLPEKKD